MADEQVKVKYGGDTSNLDKANKEAEDKVGSTGQKLGNIAKGATVAIGGAFVALGTAAVSFGTQMDNAYSTIVKATGATGDALAGLQEDFKAIYNEVPDDMGAVANALGEVNTRLGLTGEELQYVTKQFLDFGRATGTDAKVAVAEVTRLMGAWGVEAEDMGLLLDQLTVAGQASGISIDRLAQLLQSGRGTLQQYGFGLEESIAMMAQFELAGVNVENVMVGLRGVLTRSAAEGRDAQEYLKYLFDTIESGTYDIEFLNEATLAFGSRAAPEMIAAIQSGQMSWEDMAEAIQNAGGALKQTTADSMTTAQKFEKLMHSVQTALGDVFIKLQPVIDEMLPMLSTLLGEILTPITELVTKLLPIFVTVLQAVLPTLSKLITTILPPLVSLFDAVITPIARLAEGVMPILAEILEAITPLLSLVLSLLEPILAVFNSLVEPILDLIKKGIEPFIKIIQPLTDVIQNTLQPVLNVLMGVFNTVFGSILEVVSTVFGKIMDIFGGLIDFIANIFSGNWEQAWEGVKNIFANVWEAIKNVFKAPINWIIDGINMFLRGLNNIKIPDWVPLVGGKGFNVSLIPRLQIGEDFVPEDMYPAYLDYGERVLTAQQNVKFSALGGLDGMERALSASLSTANNSEQVVYVTVQGDVEMDGFAVGSVVMRNFDDNKRFT